MTMPQPSYPQRYFRLRYDRGFTDAMIAAVREGCREWQQWVQTTLDTWHEVPHRAKLPKPAYSVAEPEVSHDRRMITVRLEGDPITHGTLMTFEDGVPVTLYRHIAREDRRGLKVAYENPDLTGINQPPIQWQDAVQ